ncbi:MAG: ABC transporter permease subunit [Ahrensia sp.]|nr:ABC transporter permease subunit [Ahrensia sp.]
MSFNAELIGELALDVFWLLVGILILAAIYVAVSMICFGVWYLIRGRNAHKGDFVGRKTVTFGDESAITPNRIASVASVISLFLFWGVFTGSVITPLHVPAPYEGRAQFTYTVQNAAGETQDATVIVDVTQRGTTAENKPDKAVLSGLAADDYKSTNVRIPTSIRALDNDAGEGEGLDIVAINGMPVEQRNSVDVGSGEVVYTPQKRLFYKPNIGWQMDPVYLPSPEKVWERFLEIATEGYRGFTLAEHVGYSLMRVLVGFFLGVLFGVPLGFAMGLNSWLRGWFDPIVEFMRPVPPLALIPLIIIWFGIGENGKMILLFLASLWIMTIAARSGVSGVAIQKVHAAYSLGASKWQLLSKVIFPNALPDIFTGARVAMGVCWGTVVAAELVAASQGAGMMIMVASKFTLTDIVIMGIIVIGIIGYSIDILMRWAENKLVPWKGRS